MKDLSETLPGIEKIRLRFLALLEERQAEIAHHALAAWETTSPEAVHAHLEVSQSILHQIAGSAGSLSFAPLGTAARTCENEIVDYLEKRDKEVATVPAAIMTEIDTFVSMSQALLSESAIH